MIGNGVLAIIPARGGSKGIPFKNMRPLAGVPLIGHTIRAALSATRLARVLVSTDSRAIADFATTMGVPTNRLRPDHLSNDSARSSDVVQYELKTQATETPERYDHVVLLQPTSPLRTAGHIDEAIATYVQAGAPSLISVCDVGAGHPDYMYRARGDHAEKFLQGDVGSPRQKLERLYLRNGAIYITATAYLEQTGQLVSPNPAFYVMDRRSSINIDEPDDLTIAEALLSRGN
jgi:CMP-N,N'-diacetyllegionaminic acid synthase